MGTIKLIIDISKDLNKKIVKKSESLGGTKSEIVRSALDEYFRRQ